MGTGKTYMHAKGYFAKKNQHKLHRYHVAAVKRIPRGAVPKQAVRQIMRVARKGMLLRKGRSRSFKLK